MLLRSVGLGIGNSYKQTWDPAFANPEFPISNPQPPIPNLHGRMDVECRWT